MQARRLAILALATLGSCSPVSTPAADQAAGSNLSPAQREAIGRKIWQNESGGTVDGLTAWNAGEEFPSFGIGHFIWYPAGFRGRFEESWPPMIDFAGRRGAEPPALARRPDCPWTSRAEFQAAFRSPEMNALRRWLADHVAVQTDFIIARSRAALPKVLAAAPAADRARVRANYDKVASTPQGTYALIDYVNFKGDGTKPDERYQGRGWGLLQVLQEMKTVNTGPAAAREFGAAAKRVLDRRIANSPPARGEARWRAGWHNRCDTYGRPL